MSDDQVKMMAGRFLAEPPELIGQHECVPAAIADELLRALIKANELINFLPWPEIKEIHKANADLIARAAGVGHGS